MIKINKNLTFLFIGRLTQAVISILTIRLMTELLAQSEVGNQYLINSMILWFSLVLINPVGMFVNRHIHEWHRQKNLLQIIRKLNKYFLVIALASVPILWFVKDIFHFAILIPTNSLLIYICFYIFLSTWFQTLSSFFNLFQFQKQFVTLNVISQVLGLVAAVIGVKYFEATGLNWLVGLLFGQIVSLLIAIILFKKYFPSSDEERASFFVTIFNKETFYFCYPVAIATLFMWFITQGYRLYVEKYLGVDALASLGVGLGLAASVAALVEALTTQYFFPHFYSSVADSTLEQRQASWSKLWMNASRIYIPFCFLTMAAAPFLVKVLTAEKFHHVVSFVLFGAAIEIFRQMSNIAYLASHAEKKTKNTIAPYFGGAVLLMISLIILRNTEALQVSTVMVALLFTGLITLVGNLFAVKKVLKTKLQLGSLAKSVLLCFPMIAVFYLEDVSGSALKLFALSCLAGVYCVFLVWKTVEL